MFISEYLLSHYLTHAKTVLTLSPFDVPTSYEQRVILQTAEDYGFTLIPKPTLFQTVAKEEPIQKPQAIVYIKGPGTIPSTGSLQTEEGMLQLTLMVIHEDVIRSRYLAIAQWLIEKKEIGLLAGQDAEFLLHALEETDESTRYEDLGTLVPGCPLFNVQFKENGTFTLSNWGEIFSPNEQSL